MNQDKMKEVENMFQRAKTRKSQQLDTSES